MLDNAAGSAGVAAPVIEVRGLRKDHGSFTAVHDLDLSVARGQVFALLGTNGAGKTTTIDVLTGFAAPTEGTVRVLGVDPNSEHNELGNRVGVMLQEAGFYEALTVAETVDAWIRFTPHARTRAEALHQVGLTDRAGTAVRRLSGGERRRLDLALALLGHPEVLFLDEPTTGLDPQARRHTWELLRGLVSEGLTVLLTTHYLEEAEVLADEVAIMDHGRIVRRGTLEEIKAGASSAISFRLPPGMDAGSLPYLDGAELAPADPNRPGTTEILTKTPQRTLYALQEWAHTHDVALDEIAVSAGSLEDVFLAVAATEEGSR